MTRQLIMIQHITRATIIFLILVFGFGERSFAQGFDISNAADVAHPWSSDINPAMVSFQYAQVALGLKVFHYGFLPDQNVGIQQTHINASFPFYLPYELAFGGDLLIRYIRVAH